MRNHNWFTLVVLLATSAPSLAATKDSDRPDREMLRMIDFLKEMEMIKQIEMMQDMQQFEQIGDQMPRGSAKTSLPAKRKEAAK